MNKFTKTAPAKVAQRTAVLARIDENSPWVQVESIIGQSEAEDYANALEYDDADRIEAVNSCKDEDWGDDAP